MRVHMAVLSALALLPALSAAGCPSTFGCDPPEENFTVDEPVTAQEIDALIELRYPDGTGWDMVECERVCEQTYRDTRGWEATEVRSCALTLPESPDGTGAEGQITCEGRGIEYYCEGRRPLDHVEANAPAAADPLGRSLAAMAHLEAASVVAFEQLAAWLADRGAPGSLVERCRAAAEDERHHARWLGRLASQRGAVVPAPAARGSIDTPALAVARHNAVEGCVHECFAALMAAVRAQRAPDLRLRRVFARIAADETRHGQLAWDLHQWLQTRLSPAEAAEVDAARREALQRLPQRARALMAALPPALGGLTSDEAEHLASGFARRLAA